MSNEKKHIFLKGYCLWAQVQEAIKDDGDRSGETDTQCKLLMEISEDIHAKLVEKGYRNSLRDAEHCFGKDDKKQWKPIPDNLKDLISGKKFVSLKREVKKTVSSGEQYDFGMPKIVDTYGKVVTDLIGNGSKVVCKCEVIPFRGDGKKIPPGIKLNFVAMQVIDLVPYERKDTSLEGFEFQESEESSEVSDDDLNNLDF